MSDLVQHSANDFVPLHCHSYFSILDGLNSPEDLVARAAELGHSAIAITDHGVCSGLYRFNEACKNVKQCKSCSRFFSGKASECPSCKSKNFEKRSPIKPIFGMEGYVVDDVNIRDPEEVKRHITLWAKNLKGYQNLIWLSTFGCTSGAYVKPRISLSLLEQHKEGLSVGTACVNGVVCGEFFKGSAQKAESVMGSLKDIFADDLYSEFMNHVFLDGSKEHEVESLEAMKKTLALADRMKIKSIFTYDSHYCRPEDAFCHDVLLSVQTRNTIKNPKRMSFHSSDFYMKTIEESRSRCLGREDLIINTHEIAEKVSTGLLSHIPFQDLLPPFTLPEGFKTELQYLKVLIKEGMLKKGIYYKQEYRERISMELGHIEKLGFVRYFLVLWDMVNFARGADVPVGPGRGSAAGSLCIYCLGITQLDPIKYGLLFERFINPDRVSPPDVDIDYADNRQAEMFKYAVVRYGQEYVARIGTYGTLGAKDAIKRVGKALDIGGDWEDNPSLKSSWKSGTKTLEIVNAMTKTIDEKPGTTLSEIIATNADIKNYAREFPKLFETALKMEGTITSPGEHAAGIVLCNRPIVDLIPLRHDKEEGFCSQFDKTEVEPLGLLKYDFLGLKNLRIIDKCVKLIEERHGIKVDINALEPDDQKVFKMLNDGHVHGVFQFEGGDGRLGRDGRPPFHSMSGLLMNIHIDSFEDLIACVALFRPGTLKGIWDGKSVPETYCDYKHGRKPIKLLHPKMGELLKDTYGMMCFDASQLVYSDDGPISIGDIAHSKKIACTYDDKVSFQPSIGGAFISGKQRVFSYSLSDGRSILCTLDHKFRKNDGTYMAIDAAYSNGVPLPWVGGTVCETQSDSIELSRAYLFGMLIGDGHMSSGTPTCCAGTHKKNALLIKEAFETCYPDGDGYVSFHTRCWYVSMGFRANDHKFGPNKSNPLLNDLRSVGLCVKGDKKRIPFGVLNEKRDLYLAMAAGIIDSDGHLGTHISYTSANELLLEDFSYLAWRLGYQTYRSGDQSVVVESRRFFHEILPFLRVKHDCIEPRANGMAMRLNGKLVAEYIRELLGTQSLRSFCSEHKLNRSSMRRIIKDGVITCQYRSVCKIMPLETALKLRSVEIVGKHEVGERTVFDLSMQPVNGNNFFVSSGVVAHNCYQEQVMLVARELALFTLAEADTFRKGIGKKDPVIIESLKQKFIDGCIRNNIESEVGKKVFELCESFAGYGFNRSHAACYAFIGYQCAWLKYYYKVEFAASLMSAFIGNDIKIDKYERVFTKIGVPILPQQLNKSKLEYSIEGNSVRRPLTSLRGVGEKAVEAIVAAQPFSDLKDFMAKIDGQVVNKSLFKTLVESGCMDCLGMSKTSLLSAYEESRESARDMKKEREIERKRIESFGALDLFGMPSAGL